MIHPGFKGALARLREIEWRLDRWASLRLTPDEYAEALELDRRMKRNFWRLAGVYALASAVLAILVIAIRPDLPFGKVLLVCAAAVLYLACTVLSAWYGYRKWGNRPVWKIATVVVTMVMLGGAVGFAVGSLAGGTGLANLGAEKYTRAAAITFMVGLVFAALLGGISRMRLHDAAQRAARLQAEAERERLARQGVQAELKLLQAQVEPHFLFNTLANVRYLVQTGSPDALAMLDHLIVYLRSAVPEIRSEGSTIGREAELTRAYLEIMRIRMGGALAFAIDVPEDLAAVSFPPVMLITLVENAIKHGVAPLGRGSVQVRALRNAAGVRLEVDDDGRGIPVTPNRGVGLANVRARLRALHGDAAFMALEPRAEGGTRAIIQVPA